MKIIICGGGTAGHVTPGIAIAEVIKENDSSAEIVFIGREGGEENEITKRHGYRLEALRISGFTRKITPMNVKSLFLALSALKKAKSFIRSFKPDIVIGTGGYVSWPVIKAAQGLRIPTAIHESNVYPGLTTRTLAKGCDRVLLNYSETASYLKRKDNTVTVGNPILSDIVQGTRESARRKLGIRNDEIFILSFGGSGGSEIMNRNIIELMTQYSQSKRNVQHLHASGRKYFHAVKSAHPELIQGTLGCRIVPFIEEMPTYMNAADIVISRAGAMTLSEIAAASVVPILIPSPNVTDNHQYKNSRLYSDADAALMIEEASLTPRLLIEKVNFLVENRSLRLKLRKNLRNFYKENTRELIYREIITITKD